MKTAAMNRSYYPTVYRTACRFPNEAQRRQKLEKIVDHALMAATCAGGTAIMLFFFLAF